MTTIREIYAAIPAVNCRGLCQAYCAVIPMSGHEERVITAKHGSAPLPMPNLQCDKLIAGRCSIYEDRPLICRLFGAVLKMKCPHGCTPARFMADREVDRLVMAAERLP